MRHRLAVLIALWTICLPIAAHAAEGVDPDSEDLIRLNEQCGAKTVRLIGTFGTREISRPRFDASGVRSESAAERHRPALIVGDVATPPIPPPIPWSQISEVQTGSRRLLKGFAMGTMIGLAVGGIVAATVSNGGTTEGEAYASLGAFTGLVLLGMVVGTAVGSSPKWRTVYRNSS